MNQSQEAVAHLDACIQEIRGCVGHERFLFGQTMPEMQECALGGTIVVIITDFSQTRCSRYSLFFRARFFLRISLPSTRMRRLTAV